jgi:preprotein translocase subunit SecA
LGGNAEFLARAEIEKQWLSTKGGRHSTTSTQAGKSYEESLDDLRVEYNETVTHARQTYQKEWEPFAEARNAALKRLTETYRPLLHATWQHTREQYETLRVQVPQRNGNVVADPQLLHQYGEAKTAYEQALGEYDKVIGPALSEEQQHEYETVRDEYTALLTDASSASAGQFETTRGRYERLVEEYSRAILRFAEIAVSENGEASQQYDEAHRAYAEAQQAYEEAEQRYEEKYHPYAETVAAAERAYEEKRRAQVQAVEDVREQLEKAPDLYQQQYDEVLEKYQRICAEERAKVVAAGGLHIIGTERHEARRIDNQLRGRAGRQGDPGSSRFYLSLEDDLLRIFGAERIQKVMDRLGMEEGEPIEHGLVTRAIENAQKRVEAQNFDIRKHLLEYDDVMNKQREIIYQQRRGFLAAETLKPEVINMVEGITEQTAADYANPDLPPEEWDWKGFDDTLFRHFNARLQISEEEKKNFSQDSLADFVRERALRTYEEREQTFTSPVIRYLEKMILLQSMDNLWKDHLLSMDHLKEGIGLRGYGQKNPLQEYQKEAFAMFEELSDRMQEDVVEKLFTVQITRQEDAQRIAPRPLPQRQVMMSHGGVAVQAQPVQIKHEAPKVGRNDPCPCGSGKKYKRCHGA